MSQGLVQHIADAIQTQGRKACSGEYLVFDRHSLERVIEDAFRAFALAAKKPQT